MTTPTPAQIDAAFVAFIDAKGAFPGNRKAAIEAALTAAAQVVELFSPEDIRKQEQAVIDAIKSDTIERCAQVADTWEEWSKKITAVKPHWQIADAIRKLKEQP